MNPLAAQIVGVVVRAVLLWLGARLSAHGATPDMIKSLVSTETQEAVVGWLCVTLPIAWSVWEKQASLKRLVAAGHLPPEATLAEIKERAAKPDIAALDLKRE